MRVVDVAVRTRRRVAADLRTDRTLRYILAVAALLAGFWFWYRAPNFGTPDEYSRLLDPMTAAGYVLADPGVDTLVRGVTDGRALGATFYLYGLVLVPVFGAVVLSGQFGTFAEFGAISSRWTLWQAVPAWYWTASIVLGRLLVVVLSLSCVYLTYRLGTEIHDRTAGRIAAGSLALSLGFLSTAHGISEDIPMLCLFVLSVVLVLRYVRTGEDVTFLVAALLGGLAIAFKLTAGTIVFVLGVAFLIRARADGDLLSRGRLGLFSLALLAGIGAIVVGMPSVLVGGPEELLNQVTHTLGQKTSVGQPFPPWYYLLSGYLNAFGLPLFAAILVGLATSLRKAWTGTADRNAVALLSFALVVYVAVFSSWQWVRTHHLLPTLPLTVALLGVAGSSLLDRRGRGGRLVLIALVLSTGLYATTGVLGYTTDPRESATSWLATRNVSDGELEVYENSVADVGVPHGIETIHYRYPDENAPSDGTRRRNESDYTAWLYDVTERRPRYIEITSTELQYLDPGNPVTRRYPRRTEYFRALLDGEYPYEVATTFGSARSTSLSRRLLEAGIVPRVEQRVPRVIILERTRDSRAHPPPITGAIPRTTTGAGGFDTEGL